MSDAAGVPGRFNLPDYRGATLIADYGHNPDAIAALVSAIESMPAKRAVRSRRAIHVKAQCFNTSALHSV